MSLLDYIGRLPSAETAKHRYTMCSVPGCERRHSAKGMCDLHYNRHKRGIDLSAAVRKPQRKLSPFQIAVVRGSSLLGYQLASAYNVARSTISYVRNRMRHYQ